MPDPARVATLQRLRTQRCSTGGRPMECERWFVADRSSSTSLSLSPAILAAYSVGRYLFCLFPIPCLNCWLGLSVLPILFH
ncbi:hypothetical protein BO70DRAFT_48318 [Aspergillus heteromorphus CBS 117.55]|uniref:Uncharacterized protein n=1 Tax=Aspergillus heteromorphus CBS 117.55 TaxID=1448321 RepID=A0A317W2B1_9EURO|nr:uncharacterized protein BO70DRAFT_48318 [Aspergillus heteromorphus CBS 117.55]PWY80704.1 hypothetical protein BO70DRAFT_48318 [Aspergillus heteromorphus CBS 117.55]